MSDIVTPSEEVIQHVINFYDVLEKLSQEEPYRDGTVRIFSGSLTKVWKEIKASNSHYTAVRSLLEESGAVSVLRRGARGAPSVLLLVRRPKAEELAATPLTRTAPAAKVQLDQRVSNLERQIGGLNIVEVAKNFEQRLAALEKQLPRKGSNAKKAK